MLSNLSYLIYSSFCQCYYFLRYPRIGFGELEQTEKVKASLVYTEAVTWVG